MTDRGRALVYRLENRREPLLRKPRTRPRPTSSELLPLVKLVRELFSVRASSWRNELKVLVQTGGEGVWSGFAIVGTFGLEGVAVLMMPRNEEMYVRS